MNRGTARYSVRRCLVLFVFLSAVYHSNLRPVAAGDSLPASLIPFSILLDGSITLDRFGPYLTEHVWYGSSVVHKTGTHYYSIYPIAGPVLATPLYLPIALVPWFRSQPPGTLISVARVAEKMTAVTLAAATAIALYFLLRRLISDGAAWMLTLLFAFGTANWSTASQALWQHTFGQLAVIGCLYAITRWSVADTGWRWYWVGGSFAGLALAIRPTNVALIPALAIALWLRPARLTHYASVFVPIIFAAVLTEAYNFAVFHSLAGGYTAELSGHAIEGLFGILVSPARGLLIYTPIAVFALAAFSPLAREGREKHWLVVVAAAVFTLSQIALISMWPIWWGGYCWGPRLLTEIFVPLMVLIAVGLPAIQWRGLKWAFAAAAVYCCLIQALGVYCYPKGRWDHLPVSVDDHPERVWNWVDNPVIRTAQAGIAWEPYSIVAAAASGGLPAAAKRLQQLGINAY